MNWPNRVIDDIKNGENIDVYFTILVGIIAGILVFLPSSTAGIIGGLTLTVLCFLANSIVGITPLSGGG